MQETKKDTYETPQLEPQELLRDVTASCASGGYGCVPRTP